MTVTDMQIAGTSTEAWSHNEDTLLLTTGGLAGNQLQNVEVYPSTSSCTPPRLPRSRDTPATFLTTQPNPTIAVCGGRDGHFATASCLVLDKSNQLWRRSGNLTMPRKDAAVASLNSVGVFIIGGGAANNQRTSDFLAAGQMQWQEGPALPMDMTNLCAVTITPTSYLTIYDNHIREFDAAIAGPTTIEGWRDERRWPRLKSSRTAKPGCAKLGQKVIIAGGYNHGGEVLSSTEVLNLNSREITAGGDMASPRSWFHLATIRRGGEEKVFALGGWMDGSTVLNTVEELVEVEESTTWEKADSFLTERRGYFGTVALPKELICPA